MAKAIFFLTDGFEETEAVTTIDILRRGGVEVVTVSLTNKETVIGKHNIIVHADVIFDDIEDRDSFDMLVIPGGTLDYTGHKGLLELVRKYDSNKKKLAAICAAPAVFGKAGILKGKKAVCYPGVESWLTGAIMGNDIVETDGHITTAKGPAVSVFFALRLLEIIKGKEIADKIGQDFLVPLISNCGIKGS